MNVDKEFCFCTEGLGVCVRRVKYSTYSADLCKYYPTAWVWSGERTHLFSWKPGQWCSHVCVYVGGGDRQKKIIRKQQNGEEEAKIYTIRVFTFQWCSHVCVCVGVCVCVCVCVREGGDRQKKIKKQQNGEGEAKINKGFHLSHVDG